jgi:hypothetical protein
MTKIVFIGIGAGLAAALLLAAGMFATVYSGSFAPILLIYLCPLPILIAGLAVGHLAALIAALCAGISLTLALDKIFLFFLLCIALPAWWLSYLSLLARPSHAGGLEWYPVGRIVLWIAAIGGALIVVAIPFIAADPDRFHAILREAIGTAIRPTNGGTAPADDQAMFDLDMLASLAPPTLATLATALQMINLWLAARIVKFFGHLRRPWPDLSSLAFPPTAPAFLAAALVCVFLPGFFGIIGGIFAATLITAYALLGLAVLHFITRGLDARSFMLGGVYALVVIVTWPALIAACVFGLIDTGMNLRGRVAGKSGPPTLRP